MKFIPQTCRQPQIQTEMAPLFDSDDEKMDLSTPTGSGTRIAREMASNDSDNTPKMLVRTISGERYLEIDQSRR